MKKNFLLTILISSLLVSFSSFGQQASHRQRNPRPAPETYPACVIPLKVALDQFRTEDFSFEGWTDDIALNSREVAVTDLVNSGCFRVLERDPRSAAPAGVMMEKILARSQEGKKGSKVAQKKQMETADYLLTYAVTGAKKGGEGIPLGIFTAIAGSALGGKGGQMLGGLDAAFSSDYVHLTCRVFDTAAGEIKASSQVKVKDSNVSFSFEGVGSGSAGFGGGGLEYFKKSKIGRMMAHAIHRCSMRLTKALVEGQILQEQASPPESEPSR